MKNLRKRLLVRLGGFGVFALLLAAMLLLGACANMPESDTANEDDSAAVIEQTPADVSEVKTEETDVAAEAAVQPDEPDEEQVAEAEEAPAEALVEVETPQEEVAAPVVEDWTQHFVAEGNYVFIGNPEAPVTILDVGDFL